MKKQILTTIILAFCTLTTLAQTLKKEDVQGAIDRIYKEKLSTFTSSIQSSWADSVLVNGEFKMPFWCKISGPKPANGYPMYISMHGGGGAPAKVNDQQWKNQKRLYGTVNGLYWVPRAPTDSWNLWHQEYMDEFLLQAVSYAVANLEVDPNRIYILGYSAGGDGTFNLAPRLADRFAAASMMAGHPGDAQPENLRNIPFAIFMGGKDAAYNRNGLAAKWGKILDSLQTADPKAFIHRTEIYPELGHWMNNNDSVAISWLASFTRNPYPEKIIWIQDDVLANRKYNLQVNNPQTGNKLIVSYDKTTNTANIEYSDYKEVTIWFNDSILNLDKPIKIFYNGKKLTSKKLKRDLQNINTSLDGRYDKAFAFPAKITVKLK